MPSKEKVLLIPAILTKFQRLKDGGVSYSFHSTVEVSNDDFSLTDRYYQQAGYLAFQLNDFQGDEIPDEDAPTDGKESLSQRERKILFAYFMKTNGKKDKFPDYYRKYKERNIRKILEKMPEE